MATNAKINRGGFVKGFCTRICQSCMTSFVWGMEMVVVLARGNKGREKDDGGEAGNKGGESTSCCN